MTVLILDNYDSFTYNLHQYVTALGAPCEVVRNDEATLADIQELAPSHIIISPGPGSPCDPAYFGVCADVIRELGPEIPILGVCLGHQGIGHVAGGNVIRAPEPMHGKTSTIFQDGKDPIFSGLPRAFEVMRYHSLIIERHTMPDCLEITAKTWDDIIMAVRHREHPIYGVQFHPESILTPTGKRMIANFLALGTERGGGGALALDTLLH